MEAGPEEKDLEVGSFTVHATRGLLRDRGSRRKLMAGAVLVSLVLMVLGSTVLDSVLDPRGHPARFIVFWLACAWVTITALLLALLDVLMVRKDARTLQQELRHKYSQEGD